MAKISKKLLKEIQLASVFDLILRERFTSTMTPYFADDRPELWTDEQKEIFDIASEVEYQFREEVLRILGCGK
jgi:hypothetical protein